MTDNFIHQHTAHCESGVVSSLLKNHGLDINESMAFGLSSGLTFAYFPFIKFAGMPLIAYRMQPGHIIKNTFKCLNVELESKKFSSSKEGMDALDLALEEGKVVGLQSSIFWLPYFPEDMSFHLNTHQMIAYGKEGDEYLISDPVFDAPVKAHRDDIEKARFSKGALAGKGLMYSIKKTPAAKDIDFQNIIYQAIKKCSGRMCTRIPAVGVKGIHYLANNVKKLATSKKPDRYKKLYLGHIVRMQEEVGTGGAGFRYLYAYFLEQAAEICNHNEFKEASQQLTDIGDKWRLLARDIVIQCRDLKVENYSNLANTIHHIADEEEKLWRFLARTNKDIKNKK